MSIHELKTTNPHFENIWFGRKKIEVRYNDRDYKVGDFLLLREYDPVLIKYGNEVLVEVTFILDDPLYCKEGYVIMQFTELKRNNII